MAYMSHKNLKGKRLIATLVWFKDLARYTIHASSLTLNSVGLGERIERVEGREGKG